MRYATQKRDLISGEGSKKAGGRWNPKNSFHTVYGSLDVETAQAETLAHHRRQGLPVTEALPLVLVGLRVSLDRIIDLTVATVCRKLGLSRLRMIREPWRDLQQAGREALTQAIGRLAREAGLEGLLVPSAVRPRARNLVLFPDNLLSASRLEIVHAEQLPSGRREQA